jgi:hypothetical protein
MNEWIWIMKVMTLLLMAVIKRHVSQLTAQYYLGLRTGWLFWPIKFIRTAKMNHHHQSLMTNSPSCSCGMVAGNADLTGGMMNVTIITDARQTVALSLEMAWFEKEPIPRWWLTSTQEIHIIIRTVVPVLHPSIHPSIHPSTSPPKRKAKHNHDSSRILF